MAGAQEQISHMARHDALTNLPNRTLFREQLEKALRLVRRSDQLAVLCLDSTTSRTSTIRLAIRSATRC
jgi:FOG: GGDEF domain